MIVYTCVAASYLLCTPAAQVSDITNPNDPAIAKENLSFNAQAGAQLPSPAALAASRYALASPLLYQ